MTVRKPVEGAMLLDTPSIKAMDHEDLAFVLRIARSEHDDRRDAQRTVQRGLDNGAFVLGRGLEIMLAPKPDDRILIDDAEDVTASESENEKMNVRTLLGHEPRLGDSPTLTTQPSIEALVRAHYERLAGKGQGDILADMYLEKIREASAGAQTETAQRTQDERVETPEALDGAIDAAIAKEFVANLVRRAVIQHRRPQTDHQIVALIVDGVRDGSVFDASPELRRSYANGGLMGDRDQATAFVITLVSDGHIESFGDGYVARAKEEPTKASPKADAPRERAPDPKQETPRHDDPKPQAAKPEAPRSDPLFAGLGALLGEVGVDLKVGNVDIVSGVEKASRTGNVGPLVAGLAGVLLSAVATADSRKKD